MEKIAVIYHRLIENAYLDLTVKKNAVSVFEESYDRIWRQR